MTPFEFIRDLWHQKNRVRGLSCSVVCLVLPLAIFVEHQLVTGIHTNIQGGREERRRGKETTRMQLTAAWRRASIDAQRKIDGILKKQQKQKQKKNPRQ